MVDTRYIDDRGFSLTELIVVLVLLGVVLSISYGAMLAVFNANDVAYKQAVFASEVSGPLHVIEKMVTQATVVEEAEEYSITFLTDRDRDNLVERHLIEALADGTLRHRTWLTDASRTNTSLAFDATWSENNVNQQEALPLVYYYGDLDDDGLVERLTGVFDVDDVKYVDINVIIEWDEDLFDDTRSAWMRNM